MMCLLLAGASQALFAGESAPLYAENFERAALNKTPENFLILNGEFAVREESGNKFLELPGAPLDTFGFLLPPVSTSDLVVRARVFGTGKGRRFPTFAVGANGDGGFKLQISPGKKALELLKGDDVLASAPFEWESGSWTTIKLQLRQVGEQWKVEGKAWKDKTEEPKPWMLVYDEKNKPTPGRPGIWAAPYAGTPIRIDDLAVEPAAK